MTVSSDSTIVDRPKARDAEGVPVREGAEPAGVAAPRITPTDGELLTLFTRNDDRAALDRLIDRHAAMVWRVCRTALRRPQDAEDAFQATFLLLVRHARSIKSSESAAGWLYRVAYRTSLRARKKLASRREESLAVDPHAPGEAPFPDLLQRQTTGVLVEELMRLPAKYQTPLVMRYLEGQSRRAIADQTDTTIAAVQGQLARGKQMLRHRLLRRGVSLAGAMAALGLGARGAKAVETAPAHLVASTTSHSVALASSGSLAVSAAIVSLYQEGARAMLLAWLGKPAASVAAAAVVALMLLPNAPAGEGVGPTPGLQLAIAVDGDIEQATPAPLLVAQTDPKASRRRQSSEESSTDRAAPKTSQMRSIDDPEQRSYARSQNMIGYLQQARKHEQRREALVDEIKEFEGNVDQLVSKARELAIVDERLRMAHALIEQTKNRVVSEEKLETINYPIMNRAYGHAVDLLQRSLNKQLEGVSHLEIDSDYGPKTAEAVARFQREVKLPATGFADAATRKSMGLVDLPVKPMLHPNEHPAESYGSLFGIISRVHRLRNLIEVGLRKEVHDTVWGKEQLDVEAVRKQFKLAHLQAEFKGINEALKAIGFDDSIDFNVYSSPNSKNHEATTLIEQSNSLTASRRRQSPEEPAKPAGLDGSAKAPTTGVVGSPSNSEAQYGPDSKMKQGQWRVFHEPSELNANGWAVVAELRAGEHAPILLRGDKRPRPHVRLLKEVAETYSGTVAYLEIVDANPGDDLIRVPLSTVLVGKPATFRLRNRTDLVEIAYLQQSADEKPAVVLIRHHKPDQQIGLPALKVAQKLLNSGKPEPTGGSNSLAAGSSAPLSARVRYSYPIGSTQSGGVSQSIYEPSDLNPHGWVAMAHGAPGIKLSVVLPGGATPNPKLKLLANSTDDWAQLRIEHEGDRRHLEEIALKRDEPRLEVIAGQRVQLWYRSIPAENSATSPRLLLIARGYPAATQDDAGINKLPPPSAEATMQRLYRSRKQPPKQAVAARPSGRVDYTDNKPDGKKSLGGSGHLIRFELPDGAIGVKNLRVHGSRYGTKAAPREDFEISFLSEDRTEILAVEHAAYGLFRRGEEKWTTIRFDKPVVDLPKTFWVAIDFNPGRTKGVYLSYDTSTGGERSMTGLAQQEPEKHQPVTFGGDWMVQLILERGEANAAAPPTGVGGSPFKALASDLVRPQPPVEPANASPRLQTVAKPTDKPDISQAGIPLTPRDVSGDTRPSIAFGGRNATYGYSVGQLQERLNEVLDPSPGLAVDGDYGPLTEAAVKRFQKEASLPESGFADELTRDALGFVEPGEAKSDAAAIQRRQSSEEAADTTSTTDVDDSPPDELLAKLRGTATYQAAPPGVQQEFEKRLAKESANAERRRLETVRYVVGRVMLDEGDKPELVHAQMEILPGGFFFDLLGDTVRPVAFRLHGYDPLEASVIDDAGPITDLQQLKMTRTAESDQLTLTAQLALEGDGDPASIRVKLRTQNGPINTPSNGYEPRPKWSPGVEAEANEKGELRVLGLSPIGYYVDIRAEGYVSQTKRIDASTPGASDLGKITLERPKQVELEYVVYRYDDGERDPQLRFDEADVGELLKPKRVVLKPGEKFVSDPERMSRGTSDFRLEQKDGKLTFRSSYGPFYSTDLGEKDFANYAGLTRVALTARDNPEIIDNHVYLLRSGYFDHHLLVRARVLKPGGERMSETDRLVERYNKQLDAAEESLENSAKLREQAAATKSNAVREALSKVAKQKAQSAIEVCLNLTDARIDRLVIEATEEAMTDGSADVEKLERQLEPISRLRERRDKLLTENWYSKERAREIKERARKIEELRKQDTDRQE